jgi:hypothetical protein
MIVSCANRRIAQDAPNVAKKAEIRDNTAPKFL